jgi:hypothetical protein
MIKKLQIIETLTHSVQMALSKISKGYETLHVNKARDELHL